MELIINTETKTIHCNGAESLNDFKKEVRKLNIDLTEYSYLRMKTDNEMKKLYKVKKDEIKSTKKGWWVFRLLKWKRIK